MFLCCLYCHYFGLSVELSVVQYLVPAKAKECKLTVSRSPICIALIVFYLNLTILFFPC